MKTYLRDATLWEVAELCHKAYAFVFQGCSCWTCSPFDQSEGGAKIQTGPVHGHRKKSLWLSPPQNWMHTLTALWPYIPEGAWHGVGHETLSCMCICVCVCVCPSPLPPGQGRTPLQWALTWPLNTDPLQSQGQRLTPHCCQSRLVNEQLLSRSQGAFRV